ncbi:dopamine beta-hydroxylase-like [Glandiceps talaboti]
MNQDKLPQVRIVNEKEGLAKNRSDDVNVNSSHKIAPRIRLELIGSHTTVYIYTTMAIQAIFKVILFFTIFVVATKSQEKIPSRETQQSVDHLRYNVPLNSYDDIHLSWEVDYSREEVIFRLERSNSYPTGWFAFGMSDQGSLATADFLIWWKTENDLLDFTDAWTDKDGILHGDSDSHQDFTVNDYIQSKNVEVLTFTRNFDTCDDDDYVIEGGTVDVIYAFGYDAIVFPEGLDIMENNGTGMQRIQILKSQVEIPSLPNDTNILEILAPKVLIPHDVTTYWCSTHKLPDLPAKNHIIRFESVITPENEGLVHHMEVFLCEEDVTEMYNAPCQTENKPKPIESCKHVLGAWAMGAEPFVYPKEAGVPLGGEGFAKYVVLEVHYNNPDLRKGAIDTSGMRFYYTPNLRPHDAGIMELGLIYTSKMAIPPQSEGFILDGYCTPGCTKEGLSQDGIQVFASQLHTHLTGVAVWTRHIRNGVELQKLNEDKHYSSHFQEIRLLKKQVSVLPGDLLITSCRYKTMDRENVTLGGFGIEDEMCVNYIHYYPRSELEVCKSSISTRALNKFFTRMYKQESMPLIPGGGAPINYNLIDWSRRTSFALMVSYQKGSIEMMCLSNSGEPFPGQWSRVRKPTVKHRLWTRNPCKNLGTIGL